MTDLFGPETPSTHVESIDLDTVSGRLLDLIIAVSFVPVFGFVAGVPGLVTGAVVTAVWYGLGTPYAIAIGHLGIVVVVPTMDVSTLLPLWAVFVALLLAPAVRSREPAEFVLATSGGVIAFSGLAWVTHSVASLTVTTIIVGGALALVTYAFYRYELVALGQIHETN